MDQDYPKMADLLAEGDIIDFGDVSAPINALLQQGVVAYYDDRARADGIFRQALAQAPTELPVYYCLYKIHTYQGNLDAAREMAELGMTEAARQAGLPADWRLWPTIDQHSGPARFAIYSLKALSFIHLKRKEGDKAREILAKLAVIHPDDGLGAGVIADMARVVA